MTNERMIKVNTKTLNRLKKHHQKYWNTKAFKGYWVYPDGTEKAINLAVGAYWGFALIDSMEQALALAKSKS